MLSKTSLFNKGIILQIGRTTGWISIVYLIGLLIALPIHIMMMLSDKQHHLLPKVDHLFQYNFSLQLPLLITVPVLMAIFLFRYLHIKKASDLIHSLPMKREQLFHHYALSGIFLLILPIIVNVILLLFIHTTLGLNAYFTVGDIFCWAGITMLMNLSMYTVGIFLAMMTGTSTVQAVLTYIVLFFPVGITILLFYNFNILFYGFPIDFFFAKQLMKMSPITYITVLSAQPFDGIMVIVYSILSIIIYWLSLFFYKKRKTEAASEAIAFTNLRSVFKYGVTFCMMLAGGAYFHEVSYTSPGWTIFGYAIGAAAGYYSAEMTLQKTWRVLARFRGLAAFLLIMLLAVAAVKTLGIYENRIPAESEVKSVILGDTPFMNQSQNNMDDYKQPLPMKSIMMIEKVRKLHQNILANQKMNQRNQNYTLFIQYELLDGRTVIREYRINQRLYDEYLKPIYGTAEYKRSAIPVFKIKQTQVQSITIFTNLGGKRIMFYQPQDVKQVLDLLKEDILAESYDTMLSPEKPFSVIRIDLGNNQSMDWRLPRTYRNLTSWLEGRNLIEKAKVRSDKIE